MKKKERKINYHYYRCDNKEGGFIHNELPFCPFHPEKDYECQYPGKDIKRQKSHDFIKSLLDNFTAKVRNKIVIAIPTEHTSQGLSPAAPGTNTPTTSDANMIFAPSRKKSEIMPSLFSIQGDFIT